MLTKDTMRFGNVIWQINPEDIKFSRSRKLAVSSDGVNSRLFDGGEEAALIRVSGCFFGDEADSKARELGELMEKAEALPLYLPGMGVTCAKLKKLESQGRRGFGKAGYDMEFLELKLPPGKEIHECVTGRCYVAAEGDSIWDAERKTGISAERLIRLNPHIRHINLLEEGEVLWLR